MNDAVNHPTHYTDGPAKCSGCGKVIECIDVVEHLSFSLGNAVKYIWRMGKKDDARVDLRKAIWYLTREAAKLEAEHIARLGARLKRGVK
jgi:hypothetical protein